MDKWSCCLRTGKTQVIIPLYKEKKKSCYKCLEELLEGNKSSLGNSKLESKIVTYKKDKITICKKSSRSEEGVL